MADPNSVVQSHVTSPELSKSDQKGSKATSKLSLPFTKMDIPRDTTTGAYKMCLRPQDKIAWKGRNIQVESTTALKYFIAGGKPRENSIQSAPSIWKNPSKIQDGIKLSSLGKTLKYFIDDTITKQFIGVGSFIAGGPLKVIGIAKKKMPVCGNWCGLGHPGPTENPQAVDSLDNLCRSHDLCYRKFGQNCLCDQMMTEVLMKDRTFFELNPLEQQMVFYFAASPCNGCKSIAGQKSCFSLKTR